MSKNKGKNKATLPQLLSPERYIRERARNLPIEKCYMPKGILEASLGTIVVIRKMPSGNFVVGTYMVDMGCLGLKNTMYRFNMDEDDLEDLLEHIGENEYMEECPYLEVHNLIYGAIAYAEDLGFEPEKDWRTSQYILEEDSDDIELIEYEFGKDGKPFYFAGPFDNVERIMNTLKRSVGEGNFTYMIRIGEGDDDFDDFDDEDDEDEDDIWKPDEIQSLAADIGFDDNDVEKFDFEIYYETRYSEAYLAISNEEHEKIEILAIKVNEQKINKQTIEELEAFILKNPKYPQLYNYLTNAYIMYGDIARAEQIIENTVKIFPEYLYGKATLALRYLIKNKSDEAFEKAYNGIFHLSDLYPDRKNFHANEFAAFYSNVIYYFILKKESEKAELYLNLIEEIAPQEGHTKTARKLFDERNSFLKTLKFW